MALDEWKTMARLKKDMKLFIVRSLAVFNTPKETSDLIQQEFGEKVTPQQCESYDPTKRSGQNLSQEFRDEFKATRNAFVEAPKNIPIANVSYRLQRLQKIIDHAGKNSVLVMDALKQAAQDEGGAFTNRKEITGKDGAPIQQSIVTVSKEDVKQALQDLENEV